VRQVEPAALPTTKGWQTVRVGRPVAQRRLFAGTPFRESRTARQNWKNRNKKAAQKRLCRCTNPGDQARSAEADGATL